MTDEQLAILLRQLSAVGAVRLLRSIAWQPGQSTGGLARALKLHQSRVATVLNVLLAGGLLARRPRKQFTGNTVEWSLSDHGRVVLRMLERMAHVAGLARQEAAEVQAGGGR